MPETEGKFPSPDPNSGTQGSNTGNPLKRLWLQIRAAVKGSRVFHPDEWPVRKMLRRSLVLGLLIFGVGVLRHSVIRVRENQVGVMVDNLRGNMVLKERVGYHLFIPYLTDFYVLDRTLQRLDLAWAGSGGGGRDIKLKTADGSNVSLDVSVTFKLDPKEAVNILRRSGRDRRFAETWMEPFVRQACLSSFGQLTTEEMYDAARRNEATQEALEMLNEALGVHGLEVVVLLPGEFRFYREYERVIQEKKLADQEVEEQQAQARALKEDQHRQLVEARKRAEARLEEFAGECAGRLIQAQSEAEKMRREADVKYATAVLAADAGLYRDEQEATGRKALLFAEADAVESRRMAMAGLGGMSMVGMEYAKRLARVRFSGTPITREPSVRQFAMETTDNTEPVSPQSAAPVLETPPAAGRGQPAPQRTSRSQGARAMPPPQGGHEAGGPPPLPAPPPAGPALVR